MHLRLALLAVLLALGLAAGPGAAQDPAAANLGVDALYTVPGVEVDATGANTVEARNNAFLQGQRRALAMLLERLRVDPALVSADALPADAVTQLMQSFQVNDEKTSPGHYRASLTFKFQPEAVRALLQGYGIVYEERVVQPVLVLPVYRSGDRLVLWDSPNPWFEAWMNYADPYAAVPIVVPYGDLEDVAAISAEQAAAGDPAGLARILARYGTGGVVVATATESEGDLAITVDRFGPDLARTSATVSVPAKQTGTPLFADAVSYIASAIQQAGPVATGPVTGPTQMLSVVVPLAAPDDWFQIRQRLGQIPAVAAASVSSLSVREAALTIEYVGTEDELRQALAAQNLVLQPGPLALELRRTDGGLLR